MVICCGYPHDQSIVADTYGQMSWFGAYLANMPVNWHKLLAITSVVGIVEVDELTNYV